MAEGVDVEILGRERDVVHDVRLPSNQYFFVSGGMNNLASVDVSRNILNSAHLI